MVDIKLPKVDIKLPQLETVEKGASIISKLIIPIGVIAIGYYILKTWKVIGTAGSSDSLLSSSNLSWMAIPEYELTYLRELVDSL
jgi:hypothetical protein